LPLPFLLTAPMSYIKLAFNFSRDFEHRVNMAWGFLGCVMMALIVVKCSAGMTFGTIIPSILDY
jgi:hypothetical protein